MGGEGETNGTITDQVIHRLLGLDEKFREGDHHVHSCISLYTISMLKELLVEVVEWNPHVQDVTIISNDYGGERGGLLRDVVVELWSEIWEGVVSISRTVLVVSIKYGRR